MRKVTFWNVIPHRLKPTQKLVWGHKNYHYMNTCLNIISKRKAKKIIWVFLKSHDGAFMYAYCYGKQHIDNGQDGPNSFGSISYHKRFTSRLAEAKQNKTLVVITDNVASLRKLLLTTITRVGERKNPHITALSNMAQINHADWLKCSSPETANI